MTWNWQCAYVQSASQDEVMSAVRKTMLALTDELEEVDCNLSRYWIIHPFLRALVSPQKDNWVAIWGLTDYLYNLVLRQNNFYGVTIFAECPSNIDEESAWEMIVWQDGFIKDWFISDVRQHILNIYRELLANEYGKMLLTYLGLIDLKDGYAVLAVTETYTEKFSNNLRVLSQFTRANVTDNVLKAWLSLPDYDAMEQIADIFSFPYLGLDYREDVMSSYLDVHQGFGKHIEDYRFAKPLDDIDKYQLVGFEEKNKELRPLEISDSIFSLISYQNYVRRT